MSATTTAQTRTPGSGASLTEQQRRRRSRRRAARRGLVALLVVAGLVWLVGFSSVLDTRSVAVSGTKIITPDEVRRSARVPLGRPLARQDVGAVRDRVAGLPAVESVRVSRSWPHTLSVSVVERKPVLAVASGGGFTLIDSAGVSFQTVSVPPAGVVRTEIDRTEAALLVQAGQVAAGLPEALRKQTRTIRAGSPDSFRLVLDSGLVVTWGTAADSPLKGEITLALLERKPKAVDVSAPHSPAIR